MTKPGYGTAHQRRRRELLPSAIGQRCPLCGRLMLQGQTLHLDHVIPIARGGKDGPVRIVHGKCNMSRGGWRLANQLRRLRKISRW